MNNNLKLKEKKNIPLEIVEYYFKNGSLRKTAKEFNIHYQTLYKWVKNYRVMQIQDNGKKEMIKEKLLTGYRRPWNRISKELEEKIALLKERYPGLTVRKAKEILEKQGIKISIKGIWNIWKRYGYAGFKKEKLCNDFIKYIVWTKEAIKKYSVAKTLYENGEIEKCARVLNSIPSLPENDLIKKIPDKYLNLKRKAEKIVSLFGEIPLKEYLKKINDLYKKLKNKNLNYLLLRIEIQKLMGLEWAGKINIALKEIDKIKKLYIEGKKCPFEIKVPLLITEGFIYAIVNIKKTKEILRKVVSLLKNRKSCSPYFIFELGSLYGNIFEYNKAENLILNVMNKLDEKTKGDFKRVLVNIYFNKGEYEKALKLLKETKFYEWAKGSLPFIYKSFIYILKGDFQRAISLANSVLKSSKKEGVYLIFNSSFNLASIYSLLDRKRDAENILKEIMPFLKKNKLINYKKMIESLICKNKEIDINFPLTRLVFLLRNKKYYRALSYAKNKGIMHYLYKYIAFFPEGVNNLIKNGKKTYLPKSILKTPIFNKEVSVYNVKFLGKLKVYKNNKYLITKLSPKEKAFLIHLSLKIETPQKQIELDKIYENFWKNSKNPSKNLSILLYKIKKKLRIPSHLIEISKKENVLKNRGIYFINDYLEFETFLAQANAFLNLNEWKLAKRKFIKAFKLIRGKIFEKIYDNWSEDLRTKIINRYEEEIKKFRIECIKRKDFENLNKFPLRIQKE